MSDLIFVLRSPIICGTDHHSCTDDPQHLVEMMNIYSTKTGIFATN